MFALISNIIQDFFLFHLSFHAILLSSGSDGSFPVWQCFPTFLPFRKTLLCPYVSYRTALLYPQFFGFPSSIPEKHWVPWPVVWYESNFPRWEGSNLHGTVAGLGSERQDCEKARPRISQEQALTTKLESYVLLFPHPLSEFLFCRPKYRFSTQVLKCCSKSCRSY